jgi:glycerol-3-phosphate O-acyltransferase/dihydroxyacetone phosphate acyltransferase
MSYKISLRTEALAASAVKVAGRDVLATWKVLISLVMTPALYAFYAFIATVISFEADIPFNRILWTPILTLLALPCIGYAALKFGEAGVDVLKFVALSMNCNSWLSYFVGRLGL